MDFFTHALSGAVLGMTNSEPEGSAARRGIQTTAVIASVLPDIDIVVRLGGAFAYFKYHRGPTHSILGIVVLSALLALVMARFYPMLTKKRLFLWALSGTVLHVFLDLLTSYSTFLLWPFSGRPFFTGILRFSDRTGWYLLGGAVLLGALAGRLKLSRIKPLHFALLGAVVFGAYIGVRAWVRLDLKGAVAARYGDAVIGRIVLTAVPGLSRWGYVVDTEDEFVLGTVSRPGIVAETSRLAKDHDARLKDRALESEIARVVADFSPLMHVRTEREGERYVVSFSDLRYGPNPRLRAEILLDESGTILGESYLGFGRRIVR